VRPVTLEQQLPNLEASKATRDGWREGGQVGGRAGSRRAESRPAAVNQMGVGSDSARPGPRSDFAPSISDGDTATVCEGKGADGGLLAHCR
jgi:hypothetical protein